MKKIILLISLMSIANGHAGEKISVTVKGMVCSFCSQGITKKFKEQPMIKDVNVDLDTHLVSLELNDNQKINDKLIETILKDTGYGVEAITRK